MKGDDRKRRLSPAMVISLIALAITLSGTAYAALSKNSVGSRQLKPGAVTNDKIADNAVNGAKVLKQSLTGADVNLAKLGAVPSATDTQGAETAKSLSGHAASCPKGATLIRGVCFDSSSSGPILGVKAAADKCAEAGGFLPTPEQLLTVRNVIDLGDGNGAHSQFTDSYFADPSSSSEYSTIVVNSAAQKTVQLENAQKEIIALYEYICAYPLVR